VWLEKRGFKTVQGKKAVGVLCGCFFRKKRMNINGNTDQITKKGEAMGVPTGETNGKGGEPLNIKTSGR